MKRVLIELLPFELPNEIEKLAQGAKIFDSSCSPEARVYFIDKDGGYYLKQAKNGSLLREKEMTEYFHKKGLGTSILAYNSGEYDLMLSKALKGEDCTHPTYLAHPKRLCDLLSERLRMLHEIDFNDCPNFNKMNEYIGRAEKNYHTGNYDKSHFPDSFGYKSADEAWKILQEGKNLLKSDVLLHGDYCLPNVMLDNWNFAGFIDLDSAGVGDRHIDIFWGLWTLWFNLGTYEYSSRFIDGYGRDKINIDTLKIIAAAEVFG